MFCPRCGQQAAEEVRFCSRCGLPLDAASALVETGGELARPEATGELTPQQRGLRKGLIITIGGLLFSGVAALLIALRDELFPFLILAGIIFTIGVMRTLYALMLEGHAPAKKSLKRADAEGTRELASEKRGGAELPPARTVPASVYAKPGAQTSDMVAPPSITEGTTRLLDEDASGRG
jgi:hypothetical protein